MKPGDLRVISLADEAKPAIPVNADWAGVSIEYSGRHGDIVPITASYDSTGRYGTQTPFSPTVAAKWEGGMWHAGGSLTNTIMTVGNGGSDATTALLTLHFNGGKSAYEIQRQLAPGEQAWVDIGELIRTQAADAKGSVIPPDVMQGTYSIRDLKHNNVGYLFEGKINVDRTFGHAMYGWSCDVRLRGLLRRLSAFLGPKFQHHGRGWSQLPTGDPRHQLMLGLR